MLYYNLDPDTGAAVSVNDRDQVHGNPAPDGTELEAISCDEGSPVFPCAGPPDCTLGGCSDDQRHLIRNAADLLAERKEPIRTLIDAKSEELIANGFPFDGKRFSLSTNAQIKWLGLAVGAASMPYPYAVSTLDSKDKYLIPDAATVFQMYGTAMTTVGTILAQGTALKAQVNAATTAEEIEAVVDNR